jgi:phosphoglycerate dehydrogenase-like enzyme
MSRLRAALAMDRRSYNWLINPESAARLAELVDVDPQQVLTEFESPPARRTLGEVDVLITSWGCPRLDAAALGFAPSLRAVFHAAGTVKSHLVDEVWDRGIRVVSAADAGAVPVAEFTLAAIIFANKRVLASARLYRAEHTLEVRELLPPDTGNVGRRVGLIGASRVGRRVAALLAPLALTVVVSDPFLDPAAAALMNAELMPLDELLQTCDVVSLHAPSTPVTHHMIGRSELAMLTDGATLINTARGALIDHEALAAELCSGRIDAVLDVTEPEPLPADSPLFSLPNVLLTPHVSGAFNPAESKRQLDLVLCELERFIGGQPLEHEVVRSSLGVIA